MYNGLIDASKCAHGAHFLGLLKGSESPIWKEPGENQAGVQKGVSPFGAAFRCLKLWLAVPRGSLAGKTASVIAFRQIPVLQGFPKLGVADAEVTRGDMVPLPVCASTPASAADEPRTKMSTKVYIEEGSE